MKYQVKITFASGETDTITFGMHDTATQFFRCYVGRSDVISVCIRSLNGNVISAPSAFWSV